MELHLLLPFQLLLLVTLTELVRGNCLQTCLNGRCIENECNCFEGHIGPDCSQQLCGTEGKLCEEGQNCFDNQQCCTTTQCFPPLAPAIANPDSQEKLPTAAVIGIVCIVLIAVAIGAALAVAKYRGNLFSPASGDSTARRTASEKSDGIRKFTPAADVSSIDFVADVTSHWTRTPSNAANEAEGVQIPYKAPSTLSTDKTLAWEESDRKLAPSGPPEESKSRYSAQLDVKPPVTVKSPTAVKPVALAPKAETEPAKPQARRKSAQRKKK